MPPDKDVEAVKEEVEVPTDEEKKSDAAEDEKAVDETIDEKPTALGVKPKDEAEEGPEDEKQKYEDFTLPEGVTLDESKLERAIPVFQELGLDQGKAQKAVDLFTEMQAADSKAQRQEFLDLQQDWLKQLDNHPDFGGDKKEETLEMANKVVGRFGGDELRTVLNDTGMGNHWALIMAFARIGRLLTEDQLVTAGSKAADHSKPMTDGELFYPEHEKTN